MENSLIASSDFLDQLMVEMRLGQEQRKIISCVLKLKPVLSNTFGYSVIGIKKGAVEKMVNNGLSNHLAIKWPKKIKIIDEDFVNSAAFRKINQMNFRYAEIILISQESVRFYIKERLNLK